MNIIKRFQQINFKLISFCGLLLFELLFGFAPTNSVNLDEKPIYNEYFERHDKLQSEADALLPLFDKMPPVAVYLKDAPVIETGSNTERGVAYTNCENFEYPTIIIKQTFYQNANSKQLTNILKHEMTHAWLCRQRQMSGHDERFRKKFSEVGGFGN